MCTTILIIVHCKKSSLTGTTVCVFVLNTRLLEKLVWLCSFYKYLVTVVVMHFYYDN